MGRRDEEAVLVVEVVGVVGVAAVVVVVGVRWGGAAGTESAGWGTSPGRWQVGMPVVVYALAPRDGAEVSNSGRGKLAGMNV